MTTLAFMDRMRLLLAEGRTLEVARLVPELEDVVTAHLHADNLPAPVCAECHGYGEMAHPSEVNRKIACPEHPDLCPGNRYGRMSAEQFEAYMMAKTARVTEPEPTPTPDPEPEPTPPPLSGYVPESESV